MRFVVFTSPLLLLLFSSLPRYTSAFVVVVPTPTTPTKSLQRLSPLAVPRYSSFTDDDVIETQTPPETIAAAAKELTDLSKELKAKNGVLLVDSGAKKSFREAVEKLENIAEYNPTDSSGLEGDWILLSSYQKSFSSSSSSSSSLPEIDTDKIPFLNDGPLRDIRDALNDSVRVEQRIKCSAGIIDKIDHVIEYKPPNTISSFLKNLPDPVSSININPLKVSESKFILQHEAEVEQLFPVLKTKLSLQSIVVNVAGESQILDPSGADVLGINVPFGEFLNAGSFDTTYMDESIRISRSKTGPVDQIRVFERKQQDTDGAAADANEYNYDYDDDDDELADDYYAAGSSQEASTANGDINGNDDDDDEIVVEAPSDTEN